MLSDQDRWHETSDDRRRQSDILRAFTSAKRLSAIITVEGEPCDAVIFRRCNPVALAEIKYRKHCFGYYPDYSIDVHKLEAIWARAEAKGLTTLLIVSWSGEIRYAIVPRFAYPVTEQKRRDRDELADRVFHIPLTLFVPILAY